jgi:hypothetical protein
MNKQKKAEHSQLRTEPSGLRSQLWIDVLLAQSLLPPSRFQQLLITRNLLMVSFSYNSTSNYSGRVLSRKFYGSDDIQQYVSDILTGIVLDAITGGSCPMCCIAYQITLLSSPHTTVVPAARRWLFSPLPPFFLQHLIHDPTLHLSDRLLEVFTFDSQ